jgi:hypothetical protein
MMRNCRNLVLVALGVGVIAAACTKKSSSTPPVAFCTGSGGSVSGLSGTIDCLNFSLVGDTRPPTEGDTSAYPTPIINKIYQDMQADSPQPRFAIATGDYEFADPSIGSQSSAQQGFYLAAAANYTAGPNFFAMGNHECTGSDGSNCGPEASETDGITPNYTNYIANMTPPAAGGLPYFALHLAASDGSWTAKFLFVAPNSWDTAAGGAQAAWLTSNLAIQTTYTFVVRHERISDATVTGVGGTPNVTLSQNIIAQNPLTFLLEGHEHDLELSMATKEVTNGLGGAALDAGTNYGYMEVRQRVDRALDFTAYDYESHAVLEHFVIDSNGAAVGPITGPGYTPP